MEISADKFLEASTQIFREIQRVRRHLHQFPELSFEEYQTSIFLKRELNNLSIDHFDCGKTGIIAEIGTGEFSIALRADMDALPIEELNEVPYKSRKKGVMHACGHDVHTACLLGALSILKKFEKQLPGKIRAIFQPGEEKLPGGALEMIEQGALDTEGLLGIIALHVFPDLPAHHLGFRSGKYMASADEIYLRIEGKGGHGATPHLCIDPITAAASLLNELQKIVSRKAPPTIPTVLSFGKIYSEGGATNIIPSTVFIEGTLRTLDEDWRIRAQEWVHSICESIGKATETSIECNIIKGYPFLYNHPQFTKSCQQSAERLLGESNIHPLPIRLSAEDFAWYAQKIPACFFRLGTGKDNPKDNHSVHTPYFDIDEKALIIGAASMAYLAYHQLLQKKLPLSQ
jgi:amidohydrolase